jgi:hypothetical protein
VRRPLRRQPPPPLTPMQRRSTIAGQNDMLPAQRRCMGEPCVGCRLSYRTQWATASAI